MTAPHLPRSLGMKLTLPLHEFMMEFILPLLISMTCVVCVYCANPELLHAAFP
jgi:hypothetical protein